MNEQLGEEELTRLRDAFAGYELGTCLLQAQALSDERTATGVIIRELVERLREAHRVKLSALRELEDLRVKRIEERDFHRRIIVENERASGELQRLRELFCEIRDIADWGASSG